MACLTAQGRASRLCSRGARSSRRLGTCLTSVQSYVIRCDRVHVHSHLYTACTRQGSAAMAHARTDTQ
eukprot:2944-Eustigmatos_ZCMA.PRE.1